MHNMAITSSWYKPHTGKPVHNVGERHGQRQHVDRGKSCPSHEVLNTCTYCTTLFVRCEASDQTSVITTERHRLSLVRASDAGAFDKFYLTSRINVYYMRNKRYFI